MIIATFIEDNTIIELTGLYSSDKKLLKEFYTSIDFDLMQKREVKKTFVIFKENGIAWIPNGYWRSVQILFEGRIEFTNLHNVLNIDYIDKVKLNTFLQDSTLSNYTPHEHQVKALYKTILYRQSRSYVDVSGGKTFIIYLICRYAIMNIIKSGEKILIIVPKTDLVLQFANDVEEYEVAEQSDYKKLKIQQIYGGLRIDLDKGKKKLIENANVIIGTRSTLCKYPEIFFDNITVALFDECHTLRVAEKKVWDKKTQKYKQGQTQQIYNNLVPSRLKIVAGLSGTMPEEGDGIANINKRNKIKSAESLTLEALLGPIVVSKPLVELIKDGSSTDFDITQIVINIDDFSFLENYFNDADIQNEQKRRYREMELVYTTGYQENILKYLLLNTKNADKNHIILFNTKAYLEQVKEFLITDEQLNKIYKVSIIVGDVKKDVREEIKRNLENSVNNILLATYQTMDTGTSIKRLHRLYILDSCKEFYRVRQYFGRGTRLHSTKDKLKIYDFVYKLENQNAMFGGMRTNVIYRQGVARRKIYDFNNFKYKIVDIDSSKINGIFS